MGKTYLAHRLQHIIGCDVVHLDAFKHDFNETNDIKLRPLVFAKASLIMKDFIAREKDLIVEGCYIPKDYRSYFSESENSLIRSVFIVMSRQYIQDHFEDIKKYSDIIEERKNEVLDMQRLINCSKSFKQDCLENGTYCHEIDKDYSIDKLTLLTKMRFM